MVVAEKSDVYSVFEVSTAKGETLTIRALDEQSSESGHVLCYISI